MGISPRMQRTPNCVGVILDKSSDGFSGKVTNRYQKEAATFSDLPELFIAILDVLDGLNYPAKKITRRKFKKSEPIPKVFDTEFDQNEKPSRKVSELLGDEEGFIIMVLGRDNCTMQGKVYDSALDKEFTFSGDVELLRILKK